MTTEEIELWKKRIDNMSQYQMCECHRFAKSGDPNTPWFDLRNKELVNYWSERYTRLGGMTPEISKAIGW